MGAKFFFCTYNDGEKTINTPKQDKHLLSVWLSVTLFRVMMGTV